MRGFVPTPGSVVDRMVDKLFSHKAPKADDVLLDPGCGPGAFINGVIRWTERNGGVLPEIVGYENEPGRHAEARQRFEHLPNVKIVCGDFLTAMGEPFDYIIGNPPYVSITHLPTGEREKLRRRFFSAEGRFDLYLLFFEKALRQLKPGGRLVFITPEKFLYVNSALSLRRILGNYCVREIDFISEETFGDLVTYPTVTTLDSSPNKGITTKIRTRDGAERTVIFPKDGSSLQPLINDYQGQGRLEEPTLNDVCLRISCGVATGADSVFVHKTESLQPDLARFSYPTISGRDLSSNRPEIRPDRSMLVPYDSAGKLLPVGELGALGNYLSDPAVRRRLEERTCVTRKPWYAFHDSVPLPEILRPKLICKDITAKPHFWIDREGAIVPRHSAYYIVPLDSSTIPSLCDFLNGPTAADWLQAHCQRASKGFLRLQSSVLKRLPLPKAFVPIKTEADPSVDDMRFAASAAAA